MSEVLPSPAGVVKAVCRAVFEIKALSDDKMSTFVQNPPKKVGGKEVPDHNGRHLRLKTAKYVLKAIHGAEDRLSYVPSAQLTITGIMADDVVPQEIFVEFQVK